MGIIGTGTTIAFTTSTTFTPDVIAFGQMASWERPAINTSHMGTTDWHTFLPGKLVDPGESQFTIAFAPGTIPPITAVPETITIGGFGGTISGSGFITSYTPGSPLEDRMTGEITIKWTSTNTQAAT